MTKEDFFKLCLSYSNELVCLHEPNGSYIYVSPSSEAIVGYSAEELIGKNPYSYFHEDDKTYIEKNGHLPVLEGKDNTTTEYRFIRKDGSLIWLESKTITLRDESGHVTHLLTVSKDISEIKNKLDLLRKEEFLWDEAGKLAKLGAWELDLSTMTPLWSKTTYDIHEVPYDEQPALDEAINFYAEEARPVVMEMVQDAIENGKPWDKQLPFVTAKGNKIWVRTIGRPEINLGKTTKLYGVFQNITKEIEVRNQQKELIEQLSSQKSQLQEFNQIVSHNLRSPISSLNTLIQFFEKSESEDDKTEILNNIKQVSTSLNSLLEELVDAVKIISNDNIEYEEVSIKETFKKTTDLLEGHIKQLGAEISLDASGWETLSFPKLYFESILLNLLSNTLKYYSPKRQLKVTVTTKIKNKTKQLYISDNGLGINLKRYKDKVFKLHKTFHRERPGKGLGLFMTKNQIEATGGKISLESEEDKGTTFIIKFKR